MIQINIKNQDFEIITCVSFIYIIKNIMKLNFYQIGYVSIILTLFVFTIISLHQSNDSFDCNILFYLFIRVLLCVFTFLILQGSNPGYLNTKDLEEDVSNLVNNDINFIDDDFIYCSKCVSRRPLRSHHCHYCDQCVATYDHHCKVIGTCIGEGNHCRFYIFLFVNFISIILSISDIIQHRKLLNISMGDFSFFTLIIYWCYFTIVFLLFLVHSWLIITNTTR